MLTCYSLPFFVHCGASCAPASLRSFPHTFVTATTVQLVYLLMILLSPAAFFSHPPRISPQSSVIDEELRVERSAVDLYFIEMDGSYFKCTYTYRPYFLIAISKVNDGEWVHWRPCEHNVVL
jgi:hypothetical protein